MIMTTEPSAASKFGVDLRSGGDTPHSPPAEKKCVDRAKASVYSWDDPRLQKTAVVQKRITKAAVMVQRFIRACISHWQYYNEERIPLLEELEDIKRRRLEELEEVVNFKARGYEQARFELDAEMGMPAEMLEEISKTSKQLKKEIQEEKDAGINLEKDILEENQRSKKLGREEHEIKAQHTLSRLDVEVPALEEEKSELEEANDEFGQVVRALQAQLDDMNLQIGLEEKHKKRLVDTLTRMLKELLKRGAKAKVVDPVKVSIQQVYETFNPKIIKPAPQAPAPAPKTAPPAPEKAPEPGSTTEKQQQAEEAAVAAEVQLEKGPDNNKANDGNDDGDVDEDNNDSSSSSSDSSTSTSSSSEEEEDGRRVTSKTRADMGLRASTGTSLVKPSIRGSSSSGDVRASTGATGRKAPAHIIRNTSGGHNGVGKAGKAAKFRKSKSADMSDGGAFDWSDKDKVRRASLAAPGLGGGDRSRGSSPTRDGKKKDKQSNRSRSPARRSQSADLEALAKKAKARKKGNASFNWSALGGDNDNFDWSALGGGDDNNKDNSEKSEKKEKKEKKSKKSKDKDKEKSKKKKKEKDSKLSSEKKNGNFIWG